MKKVLLAVLVMVPVSLYAAGLSKVEVQIDEQPVKVADGLDSWSLPLDTTQLDNGEHMVMAKATDLSGNGSDTKMIVVKVNNLSTLSLTPSAEDVKVGDTFTLQVRMNTKIGINAAQAVISFPPNLQAISIDGNGSAFAILANKSVEPGKASITLGNITAVTGDQLVANVTVKAVASGSAEVIFLNDGSANGSMLLKASNSKNVLTGVSGGSYNILEVSDVTDPTLTITEPVDGGNVEGLITIRGTAQDQ